MYENYNGQQQYVDMSLIFFSLPFDCLMKFIHIMIWKFGFLIFPSRNLIQDKKVKSKESQFNTYLQQKAMML